ncbi:dihydrofolate reductase [Azoarcus sp. KH32C]|uniref:dihydrofolate reductase n=1 Tax=Azoarcus sp. KH32C TaxID=748247 RepID=UPI00023864B6|nr:dihydrofolate reductase [Azoarcus sp. KH32C]BAL23622.1 dihydrofolate reductase [Azoarcus sp. KH32C]
MDTPKIVFVVAVARNGVIGRDNQLPWRLKADLAHFKATTIGHPILMGRKTWESLGRPLPGRRNLVLSRKEGYALQGAEVFPSIDEVLRAVGDDQLFVIGGADLYRQLIDRVDAMIVTEVGAEVAGDAYFPKFKAAHFSEVRREHHEADEHNEYPFDFVEYRRLAIEPRR